jgi:hypothetical protein
MKLFEQKLSWREAEQACKAVDADLLSIHSQQQDETASRLATGKDAFCVRQLAVACSPSFSIAVVVAAV